MSPSPSIASITNTRKWSIYMFTIQSNISLSFSPRVLPSTAHPGLIPTDGIHNASLTLDIEFFTLFFNPQIAGINHIQCFPLFLRINSQSIFIMCLFFVLRSAYYWVMDRAWLKLGIFIKRSLSQTSSVWLFTYFHLSVFWDSLSPMPALGGCWRHPPPSVL